MKKKITFLLMFVLSLSISSAQNTFRFGTSATPEGKTLLVDSKGLILDGKHIIPVMGEIHYSRVPESEWRREIRKMKAGGINIISTYIFWIHHEPEEGKWNWSGNHNLRRFFPVYHKNRFGLSALLISQSVPVDIQDYLNRRILL